MKPHRAIASTAAAAALLLSAPAADAFCGFYVAGADAKLFNDATQVVLMRDGVRTVLSMQNDYAGPPADFAMVVPVPVVLQKDNVKTLPRAVFSRVDALSAPRLVEYWEQDPCAPSRGEGIGLGGIGGAGQGIGSGGGRLGGSHRVTIEAEFTVGEYDILILSAEDSSGLDAWLRENKYKIPENAAPVLAPYVEAGSKFFVAKVDATKVKFEGGRASLSPLRFHYDSEKFDLPVRLGLLNSSGKQDLIVHVLATDRYELANYTNVTIPTNLDVADDTRASFGAFYAALFDATLEKHPSAVVTEYAWPASGCDPCPGDMQGLTADELATLGADVLPSVEGVSGPPSVRFGALSVSGRLPTEVIQRIARQNFGRFRMCAEGAAKPIPTGTVRVSFEIDEKGNVKNPRDDASDLADAAVVSCVVKAFQSLTFPAPEDNKPVKVTAPIRFSTGRTLSGNAAFVLTRLHARYGKETLGEDLVFTKAKPITGGREVRKDGKLERGAELAPANNFQGRYAIRHEWRGEIACADPQRGRWGGPWPDVSRERPAAEPAMKLAYAQRGTPLSTFTKASLDGASLVTNAGAASPPPAPAPTAAEASPAAGEAPPAPKSGCACSLTTDEASWSQLGGLALGALALARRRRPRRVQT